MDRQPNSLRGAVLALLIVAAVLLVVPGLIRWATIRSFDLGLDETNEVTRLLGRVTSGAFVDLNPYAELGGAVDLTTIAMQESRPPDSALLDLSPYEGHLVVIAGHDGGGWLYQARVERDLGQGLGASIVLWAWQR